MIKFPQCKMANLVVLLSQCAPDTIAHHPNTLLRPNRRHYKPVNAPTVRTRETHRSSATASSEGSTTATAVSLSTFLSSLGSFAVGVDTGSSLGLRVVGRDDGCRDPSKAVISSARAMSCNKSSRSFSISSFSGSFSSCCSTWANWNWQFCSSVASILSCCEKDYGEEKKKAVN
jgi:hypothetical protein